MQKTIASIYDFPTYYDLVFGSDTAAELRFLNKCFERFVDGSVKRVFEPACGTGRLLYRMGQSGFHVGGIDLNAKAVEYCNKRLARLQFTEGLAAGTPAGIHATALCPGFTRTEFHERADMRVDGPGWMWLDAGAVARQGVRDCERGVVLSVPSRRYWAAATAARYTPRRILRAATKPKEFR